MGNWSQQQELKKEAKEKDKIRKEKLASYFLNLSQLTFVALVLGGITPLYTHIETEINWYVLVAGVLPRSPRRARSRRNEGSLLPRLP